MCTNNDKDKVPSVSIDEALRMFLQIVSPQTSSEDASQSDLFNILKEKIAHDRPAWAQAFESPDTTESEPVVGGKTESYTELKRRIALTAAREIVPEDPEERYLYNRRKAARENRLKKEAEDAEASQKKILTESLLQQKKFSTEEDMVRLALLKKALTERMQKTSGPEFSAPDLKATTFSENSETPVNVLSNRFSERPSQDELILKRNLPNKFSESGRIEKSTDMTLHDNAENACTSFKPKMPDKQKKKTTPAERDFPLESIRADLFSTPEREKKAKDKPCLPGDREVSVFYDDENCPKLKQKDSTCLKSDFALFTQTENSDSYFKPKMPSKEKRGTTFAERDFVLASLWANRHAVQKHKEKNEEKPRLPKNREASVFQTGKECLELKQEDFSRLEPDSALSLDGATRKTYGMSNKFSVVVISKREQGLKL